MIRLAVTSFITDSWTNADISNNKTGHASQDGSSLFHNYFRIYYFITPVK